MKDKRSWAEGTICLRGNEKVTAIRYKEHSFLGSALQNIFRLSSNFPWQASISSYITEIGRWKGTSQDPSPNSLGHIRADSRATSGCLSRSINWFYSPNKAALLFTCSSQSCPSRFGIPFTATAFRRFAHHSGGPKSHLSGDPCQGVRGHSLIQARTGTQLRSCRWLYLLSALVSAFAFPDHTKGPSEAETVSLEGSLAEPARARL